MGRNVPCVTAGEQFLKVSRTSLLYGFRNLITNAFFEGRGFCTSRKTPIGSGKSG